jgi:hypothetical protein
MPKVFEHMRALLFADAWFSLSTAGHLAKPPLSSLMAIRFPLQRCSEQSGQPPFHSHSIPRTTPSLAPILCLSLLLRMLRKEALGVHLEELGRLRRMTSREIMKRHGRDVVGLALANKRVVLQNVFPLGVIAARLGMKDSFGFSSVK